MYKPYVWSVVAFLSTAGCAAIVAITLCMSSLTSMNEHIHISIEAIPANEATGSFDLNLKYIGECQFDVVPIVATNDTFEILGGTFVSGVEADYGSFSRSGVERIRLPNNVTGAVRMCVRNGDTYDFSPPYLLKIGESVGSATKRRWYIAFDNNDIFRTIYFNSLE
ncbi:hypothetical protein GC163_24240 [bacterium]|nr:hypothetical protein [bacterium]